VTQAIKRVGIVCDRRTLDGMAVHQANDEYVTAVRDGAGALPLLIPSTDTPLDGGEIFAAVDGLLFTGAPSNVAPSHYGAAARPGTELDEIRDATTLPLLRAAIETGKPLLAICRGFQELNVALGGTLHQHLHELPGRLDHREPQNVAREIEYRPAHPIAITTGGVLARLSGMREATGWHPASKSRRRRPTARLKRYLCPLRPPSFWGCNGIPNGPLRTIRSAAPSLQGSARHSDSPAFTAS
jgi:gamma-glutamyl-gamma-aminobutyrate hydrolase PuuD